MEKLLKQLIEQGISEQVFPGAAAAIACGTGTARRTWLAVAGWQDQRDQSAVTEATLFDLASLSKALATALLCYHFFAEGHLHPDDTLAKLWPGTLPPDKQQISLRRLLSHSSGLAAYHPWFKELAPVPCQDNKGQLLQRILADPLAYPPQSRCLYSDFGYIILGHLLEELTGNDLATNFRTHIAGPLGLANELVYHLRPEDRARCAATEDCSWRGRMLRGEVHDEHCWLLGGVAGHAGLFGTITGVLRLCGAILDGWHSPSAGCSWAAFLPNGLQRQLHQQTWCLGFDTPTAGASSSGRYFSILSIGHLGYTGTSFWIDRVKEVVVVLLTNRVHPSRDNGKIRPFRPYFHDAVMEKLLRDERDKRRAGKSHI
ncbi:serine hydrolase domain-containing protein [Candidatus Electronema sp. PJ]|uniref:serine hydrolase domain-containing protein n=1 Tax=Candidatus Electronema sp. PJ TaxID=3401572 RepID=UPI003AA98CB0